MPYSELQIHLHMVRKTSLVCYNCSMLYTHNRTMYHLMVQLLYFLMFLCTSVQRKVVLYHRQI